MVRVTEVAWPLWSAPVRSGSVAESHGTGPRSRWRPGLRHAAQRDVAEAIYGLILATSVIAVSREYVGTDAGITALTLIATAGVFWLAHVYAGLLAFQLRERRRPTRAEAAAVLDAQWPLVQAGILPTIVLLLGTAGIVADRAAQVAALVVCLVELGLLGIVVARAGGARGALVLVSGAISLSFGLVVIALKVLVH